MRISEPKVVAALPDLGVELCPGTPLAEHTSLGIGGTTDLLLVHEHKHLPELVSLLDRHAIPHRLLGGGTNLLVADGELPWVVLQRARSGHDVILEGNFALVDAAADLGRTVTYCAKNNLGGMAFEYRHTSFAPDDIMLSVKLELPSKPFREILEGIRVCNEKRRSSQPLNQKSAGCIFKNPPGASAGSMIDALGLKGHRVGGACVSGRHANFFVNTGRATAADMLALIADVRERVRAANGAELENEVIVWKD